MRIRNALIFASIALGLGVTGPTAALEINDLTAEIPPADALRFGLDLYRSGETAAAIEALNYAAGRGLTSAKWKLGQMYATGDGVERDEYKAFELFSDLADAHAADGSYDQTAPFVANAYVQLGTFYRQGIPNSSVKRDPGRARDFFTYAASFFGDRTAQFNLAMMYYGGEGGDRDLVQAAKWANLSADKGNQDAIVLLIDIAIELTREHLERLPTVHNRRQALQWAQVAAGYGSIEGQALLGHLLFEGDGLTRQPAEGLMYLTIALARDPANEWILDLHQQARSVTTQVEWNTAQQRAADWLAQHPAQVASAAAQ